MKRQQDRDTPPKGKRSRGGYMGHDNDGRERITPEPDRREGRGRKVMNREPKNHRPERDRDRDRDFDIDQNRLPKRHKDERSIVNDTYTYISRNQDRLQNFGGQEYRTLMLGNINPHVPDVVVRDVIIKEFKKFGDFTMRITHIGEDRVAYLNFRFADDARDAKHARQNKLLLFERQVRIDAVYNTKQRQRSASPDLSYVRDSFSNRSASPPLQGMRRVGRHGNVIHDVGPVQRDRGNHSGDYGGNFDQRSQGSGRQGQNERQERFPHHLRHILPEDDDKATRTLFVGNLDQLIQDADLKRVFERYGVVEDIDIKRPTKGQVNAHAYAFVKFINLDMAHRAKVDMSGQHIGKFQCKIGYGKVSPSTCLWVGGLGPWIRRETLEREFDRFGAIHRIEWPRGENYAYVLYDSIDAAQAACQEMRGFPLGGPEKRLRVDFADESHINQLTAGGSPRRGTACRDDRVDNYADNGLYGDRMSGDRERGYSDNHWQEHKGNGGFSDRPNNPRSRGSRKDSWQSAERLDYRSQPDTQSEQDYDCFRRDDMDATDSGFDRRGGRGQRGSGGGGGGGSNYGGGNRGYQGGRGRGAGHSNQSGDQAFQDHYRSPPDRDHKHGSGGMRDFSPSNSKRRRHVSPLGVLDDGSLNATPSRDRDLHNSDEPDSNGRSRSSHEDRGLARQMASVEHVDNMMDLAKCLPVVWSGALVLKNSAFAARMHLVSGAVSLVDTLMRDTTTTEMPVLRITQRLRLDQPKLEEVGRRVLSCGPSGHSVLLAKPGSAQALEDSNTNAQIQQRPLKNLVSYLKQKEAAGVITLPPNLATKARDSSTGVLYAFPPCKFGLDFLLKCAPKLSADACSKEDHLVVVVVRAEA